MNEYSITPKQDIVEFDYGKAVLKLPDNSRDRVIVTSLVVAGIGATAYAANKNPKANGILGAMALGGSAIAIISAFFD
jgi:hypothetical protein